MVMTALVLTALRLHLDADFCSVPVSLCSGASCYIDRDTAALLHVVSMEFVNLIVDKILYACGVAPVERWAILFVGQSCLYPLVSALSSLLPGDQSRNQRPDRIRCLSFVDRTLVTTFDRPWLRPWSLSHPSADDSRVGCGVCKSSLRVNPSKIGEMTQQ
jgi:hypothetical protein